MKQTIIIIFAFFIIATGVYTVDKANTDLVKASSPYKYRTVILDAGHGGEDGGAVAKDGTLEKDINLLISERVAYFFDLFGINYIKVRNEDVSVCDEGLETVRKRKYSDIMNRFSLVNSIENSVLLSIHQNMFSESKYSGTQVFYSARADGSEELAESIQKSVANALQPSNSRKVKPAGNEIYLLHKAEHTSVLVECGFLSNSDELEKLKTPEYETQMAYFIFRGLLSFLSCEKDV